jgi:hypothetical protein
LAEAVVVIPVSVVVKKESGALGYVSEGSKWKEGSEGYPMTMFSSLRCR